MVVLHSKNIETGSLSPRQEAGKRAGSKMCYACAPFDVVGKKFGVARKECSTPVKVSQQGTTISEQQVNQAGHSGACLQSQRSGSRGRQISL